jgi:hypothetical protein
MSSQCDLLFENINGIINIQPTYSIYTGNLVINLDSTLGINGSNWTDQTGNGFNYTFYNSTTNIGTTNTGTNIITSNVNGFQAVFLDGATNFLWRSNSSGFGSYFLSSFTYEMWVYPLSKKNATLIFEHGQNFFGSGWSDDQLALNSSGYITSYVYNFGGPIGNNVSTSSYDSNNWYQIVNVYDNTAKILYQYVNGVLSTQVSVTKQYPTSVWLILGSHATNGYSFMSGLGYFCGCIGAFRGYDIALSSSQILQNYYSYNLSRYKLIYLNYPTNIFAILISNTAASIIFTLVSNDIGNIIYTVKSSPDSKTATGSSSPINITGLSPNTQYTFTITTSNNEIVSNPSNAIVTYGLPNPPTGLTQTAATLTSITISFTAPIGTINSYSARTSTNITGTSTNSPITINGLISGTEYNVTIQSTDSYGTSIASSQLLCGTLLDAPTINTLTFSAPTSIIVSFTPPTRGIVNSYSYTATSSLGNFTENFTSSNNSYTINGLIARTTYTVTLKAINNYGTSASSNLHTIELPIASGGNKSTSGSYTLHSFSVGTNTFTLHKNTTVNILIVGGGGAGGSYPGSSGNSEGYGGGGGGGVGYGTLTLLIGTYTVSVGDGGTANPTNTNSNGFLSSFINNTFGISETAYGGSRGSTGGTGSTGGGSKSTASSSKSAGSGTINYLANIGGNGGSGGGGGGGGGAGGSGNPNSGTSGGSGGSGFTWSVNSIIYGGGGGGGGYGGFTMSSTGGGNGGSGSGGNGGNGGFGSGNVGKPGTANTGGGGGGSSGSNTALRFNGGKGGSGVVIIAY